MKNSLHTWSAQRIPIWFQISEWIITLAFVKKKEWSADFSGDFHPIFKISKMIFYLIPAASRSCSTHGWIVEMWNSSDLTNWLGGKILLIIPHSCFAAPSLAPSPPLLPRVCQLSVKRGNCWHFMQWIEFLNALVEITEKSSSSWALSSSYKPRYALVHLFLVTAALVFNAG